MPDDVFHDSGKASKANKRGRRSARDLSAILDLALTHKKDALFKMLYDPSVPTAKGAEVF